MLRRPFSRRVAGIFLGFLTTREDFGAGAARFLLTLNCAISIRSFVEDLT